MAKMKAMEFTDELKLQPVRRPVPEPQAGEILIQVYAGGVTPTEKLWSTTSHYADGTARSKAIPGHEFSGAVAGLGAGATGYSLGDAVFGFNDWCGEPLLRPNFVHKVIYYAQKGFLGVSGNQRAPPAARGHR